MIKKVLLSILIITPMILAGQDKNTIGPEIMVYPAGQIINVKVERKINVQTSFVYRLGYNRAVRQDFGKHDDEQGNGLGLAFGYRYYAKKISSNLFFEAQLALWQLKINWKHDKPVLSNDMGHSNITVLQPLLLAGYSLKSKNFHWSYDFGISFGREWNVITKGEPVGEGGISLAFISISHTL